jgi:uncharacterized protein (TIGR03437 family)
MSTLAGASVQVTVNGETTDGIMYYTSDGQAAFILDSDTPAGNGTVTLTYNAQTSAPSPIEVVDSHLGFYTLDSSGSGPGVVTFHESVDVSNLFASSDNAVNPGDLVILWGNGLGPVPFDETIGAEFLDMTDVPLRLLVNGQEVENIYQGRSPGCCSSVDNIFFYWPQPTAAAQGAKAQAANSCSSTIVAEIGNTTSNEIIVPSADVGTRICSEAPPPNGDNAPIDPRDLFPADTTNQWIQDGHFSFLFVALSVGRSYSGGGNNAEQTEGGVAAAGVVDQDVPEAVQAIQQAVGAEVCTTDSSTSGLLDFGDFDFQSWDLGPAINVNSQGGQRTLDRTSAFGLTAYTGEFLPNGFLQGSVAVESQGGPDLGSFNVSGQLSNLEWTNRPELVQVPGGGFTATWSGPTSGFVTVSGERSEIDISTFSTVTHSFACTFPATQNSGSVPGNIASFVGAGDGTLSVSAIQTYQIPNVDVDLGVFVVTAGATQEVNFVP